LRCRHARFLAIASAASYALDRITASYLHRIGMAARGIARTLRAGWHLFVIFSSSDVAWWRFNMLHIAFLYLLRAGLTSRCFRKRNRGYRFHGQYGLSFLTLSSTFPIYPLSSHMPSVSAPCCLPPRALLLFVAFTTVSPLLSARCIHISLCRPPSFTLSCLRCVASSLSLSFSFVSFSRAYRWFL